MSDHDFQLQVIEGLAELRTDMKAVKDHLAKLNGKVASHERELAERRNQCPIADRLESRVRVTEDFITASRASEKTTKTWMDRLWPAARWALGVVLIAITVLVLDRAQMFLSVLHAK